MSSKEANVMKQFVIALAIAATSLAALASPHPGTPQRRAHAQKLAKQLGLSDAQKQQIRDLRKADRAQNHQLYAGLRSKVREYRQLRQANDPRARDLRAEIRPLRQQARAARKQFRETRLSVLTPEQRQQLEQLRPQRRH
jgi:Spy/CpxP family protein refolding chaperone